MERIEEPNQPTVHHSGRQFKFGDGGSSTTMACIKQPVDYGVAQGRSLNLHVVDKADNATPPLIGLDWMRDNKVLIDVDEGKMMYKDKPDKWIKLPQTSH